MILRMNVGSPFARKVRMLAHEKGLTGEIEESVVTVSPVHTNEALARENPLIKMPVLVLDNGEYLYGSAVICEYLDTLHQRTKAFSEGGFGRFATLRRQALCDGMLEAAILCRYELALRPAELRWNEWIEGQKAKVFGGLSVFESEVDAWGDEFELAQIELTCVLGYLDFRFAEGSWRVFYPHIARWHEGISTRSSVIATAPEQH